MSQPAPQPSSPEPKSSQPVAAPPPGVAGAPRKPVPQSALFHTLLEGGFDPAVAYTLEQRIHNMVSEAVAPQLQPFLMEMRQLFAAQDRRFDEQDRKLDALTEAVTKLAHTATAHGEKLAEHDRQLDVVVTRLDGLKVLGHVVVGTLALLITALIAVFGFLFTN